MVGFAPILTEYKSSIFSNSRMISEKSFSPFFEIVGKKFRKTATDILFFFIFAHFYTKFCMKKTVSIFVALALFVLSACHKKADDGTILHRSFYNDTWERFDYVFDNVEIKSEKTFDLSMKISFTDLYAYDDFSMVFSIFDAHGNPYRARNYRFNLKDAEGHWNSQPLDGCYTFVFPINKELRIAEPGVYRFQIEYRMPKTPIIGVRELTLFNENN